MPRISAVIISFNEEKYIARCIRSLQAVADEIVVLDSFSTDRTPAICRELGVKFFQEAFPGYIQQKNRVVELAENDCILSLDADEALSDELAASIGQVREKWTHDAYVFRRLNNFCGHWMWHTNLYPDRKLRLFDRRKAAWGGTNPHDQVMLQPGATKRMLRGHLLHWLCDSREEHLQKLEQFATIAAREASLRGQRATRMKVLLNPLWRFIHNYIIKHGFLSGYQGYLVSVYTARLGFLKYSKLRKLSAVKDKIKGEDETAI